MATVAARRCRLFASGVTIAFCALVQLEAATVTGKVTDQQSALIADAPVELVATSGPSTKFNGRTNRDGVYRFEGVMPGDYRITVSSQGFTGIQRKVTVPPGVQAWVVTTLELPIAMTGDCRMPVEHVGLLTEGESKGAFIGSVRLPDGSPAEGVQVALACGDRVCYGVVTGRNGRFTFTPPTPGVYTLWIRRAGFYPEDDLLVRLPAGHGVAYEPIMLERCSDVYCDPKKRTVTICE